MTAYKGACGAALPACKERFNAVEECFRKGLHVQTVLLEAWGICIFVMSALTHCAEHAMRALRLYATAYGLHAWFAPFVPPKSSINVYNRVYNMNAEKEENYFKSRL